MANPVSTSPRDAAPARRAQRQGDLLPPSRRGSDDARSRRQGHLPPPSRRGGDDVRSRHQGDLLPPPPRRGDVRTREQRHGNPLTASPRDAAHAGHTPDSPSASLSVPPPLAAASPRDLVRSWHESSTCDLPHSVGKLQLEPDGHGPIDLDALPDPLTVRWRRGGERLAPRRGGPRRALKSLLQESQVLVSERFRLPLLFATTPSGEKLLAVADIFFDETVQATSATRRRARLRWVKSPR